MDQKIYQHKAEGSKRLFFKNFFRKLSHQKKSFFKRTQQEIRQIENELELMGVEFETKDFFIAERSSVTILPAYRTEKDGSIKECYRREKRNYENYNYMLSKISKGSIREMLLFQKHSVQLILEEIESLGIRLFDGVEDEHRGEINYR